MVRRAIKPSDLGLFDNVAHGTGSNEQTWNGLSFDGKAPCSRLRPWLGDVALA